MILPAGLEYSFGREPEPGARLVVESANPMRSQPERSIIIGLGNPLLSDDAVGPIVARRVCDLVNSPDLEFCEMATGGVEMMEAIIGYGTAVIIDAILTGEGTPGNWYLLDLESSRPTRHAGMSHEIGLLEGLELGRRLGLAIPEFIRVYAVEVADPFTFGTRMTRQVERALPRIARDIASEERRQIPGSTRQFGNRFRPRVRSRRSRNKVALAGTGIRLA